jgi:hypothetical protein
LLSNRAAGIASTGADLTWERFHRFDLLVDEEILGAADATGSPGCRVFPGSATISGRSSVQPFGST